MSRERVRLEDDEPEPTRNGHRKIKVLRKRSSSAIEYLDEKTGKFRKGNKGGPGNPFAHLVTAHRVAVFAAVGSDRFRRLVYRSWCKAMRWDTSLGESTAFAKWYSDRVMGKVPDTLYLNEGTPPTSPDDDSSVGRYL